MLVRFLNKRNLPEANVSVVDDTLDMNEAGGETLHLAVALAIDAAQVQSRNGRYNGECNRSGESEATPRVVRRRLVGAEGPDGREADAVRALRGASGSCELSGRNRTYHESSSDCCGTTNVTRSISEAPGGDGGRECAGAADDAAFDGQLQQRPNRR